MKPETVSLFEVIKIKFSAARIKLINRWRKKRGMWYCLHCDKMHSRRVVEYQMFGIDSVCSIGKAEYIKNSSEFPEDERYEEKDFMRVISGIPQNK